MGDVLITSQTNLRVAKNPSAAGAPIVDVDFSVDNENFTDDSMSEDTSSRFVLPGSASNVALAMGTVALGKLLVIRPEADMDLKITNANGTSQNIRLKAARTTQLYAEFTGLSASNPTSQPLKGRFCVVGD